jgi:hypothetical protein
MTFRHLCCLWPGLASLWRGEWLGLVLACGFAGLLNGLLLTSLVWTELTTPTFRLAGWLLAGSVWLVSAACTHRSAQGDEDLDRSRAGDLFPAALGEYLQGNWVTAEQTLQRLLRRSPDDAEARLLLATLWRRTGRRQEAEGALAHLQRLAAGVRWQLEIRRELELLARPRAHETTTVDETPAARAA